MCPTSPPRRWDGSRAGTRCPRALHVASDSPSRLLRAAQSGTCRLCGNRFEWYQRSDGRPIGLHPTELTTRTVPVRCRWHLSRGVAHPAGDGSAWCRIPHHLICPGLDTTTLTPPLNELRRQLALRTRRLIDAGTYTPPSAQPPLQPAAAVCQPSRPIAYFLYGYYLADRPLDDIRCVAQTRNRRRCPHPVQHPSAPSGIWRLHSPSPGCGQLALPGKAMALYDLSHLPYAEQLRWRTQRCPHHAAARGAADLALTGWEVFDPLLHHQHIYTRLPDVIRRRKGRQE
ncbi:DUF6083 domain-containing protein [Streptomyces sp. NPDC058385]|uniref:DUF6083 domain-containing protein n=1 Tax=Streptomyces sp. NPDC058385 TaxID=3346473 RepID=UPI0036462648